MRAQTHILADFWKFIEMYSKISSLIPGFSLLPPQPLRPTLQKIVLPPLLQKSHTTTPCKITLLPSELLIQIFSHLSPYELFLLRETCVRFNKFLDAPKSSTTKEIWRNARKEFLKDKSNPPKEMSEREYTKLLYYRGFCQFCGHNNIFRVEIYWQFKARCCHECLMKNTISLNELLKNCGDTIPEGKMRKEDYEPLHEIRIRDEIRRLKIKNLFYIIN
ncbi:hypothetical protein RhiirA1_521774 [Rhizophagus irregularis]|uniref:Uncharacterized protein n=1 Tax=Rhizophagus irregularis TaxID=588596 RepID=A0A2I1EIP6_9GLOM|nr:hypothetical protein RhiirA1_521774 [Rhizophagus irregularis]PKY22001.1 hypothetical protein RhiirB3_501917 [Rhizophagus irregularis]